MIWCGLVWCGLVWFGLVWFGLVWDFHLVGFFCFILVLLGFVVDFVSFLFGSFRFLRPLADSLLGEDNAVPVGRCAFAQRLRATKTGKKVVPAALAVVVATAERGNCSSHFAVGPSDAKREPNRDGGVQAACLRILAARYF